MKGWVYIISNKAMPGILKIGYSTKDPKRRAEELNHTGSPHPYIVEYEMLIEEPYQIEQRIHKMLSTTKEGKEWFRCSVIDAIAAIKEIAASSFIYEQSRVALIEEQPRSAGPPQVVGQCPQCPGDVVLKIIGTFQYLKCTKCGQVFEQHHATTPPPAVKGTPIAMSKPVPIRSAGDLCPQCSGKFIAKKSRLRGQT